MWTSEQTTRGGNTTGSAAQTLARSKTWRATARALVAAWAVAASMAAAAHFGGHAGQGDHTHDPVPSGPRPAEGAFCEPEEQEVRIPWITVGGDQPHRLHVSAPDAGKWPELTLVVHAGEGELPARYLLDETDTLYEQGYVEVVARVPGEASERRGGALCIHDFNGVAVWLSPGGGPPWRLEQVRVQEPEME